MGQSGRGEELSTAFGFYRHSIVPTRLGQAGRVKQVMAELNISQYLIGLIVGERIFLANTQCALLESCSQTISIVDPV